jgi:hypothetical protein
MVEAKSEDDVERLCTALGKFVRTEAKYSSSKAASDGSALAQLMDTSTRPIPRARTESMSIPE